MIINEMAGSGGDAMPWYFRKAGIGPLVGKKREAVSSAFTYIRNRRIRIIISGSQRRIRIGARVW